MEVTSGRKILFVITKANWGGAQRYVFDLASAAKNKGFLVTVATGGEGELTRRLRSEGIAVELVAGLGRDVRIGGDLRALAQLYRLMRRTQPDIVHLNSSKAGFTGALAAHFADVPKILFTAHGWAFNEPRAWWQKNIFGMLHHATILLSHTTICNSQSTYDDVACMPGAAKKLVVIHNGVRPVDLLAKLDARVILAPALRDKFWLGTLSELHKVKGLPVALESFAEIADRFPETALVIMGDGEERGRLEKLAAQLKIAERVHFCGYVENGPSYLPALDLFLLPSLSESFGYVVLEAGLAGLPVIASKVGGVPEIIKDGEDGVLVAPGDSQALAAALES